MANKSAQLAAERARLTAECAAQRGDLADQLNVLQAPVARITGVAGFLHTYRKPLLAGGSVLFGMLLARPQRTLGVVASGVSLWKMARTALPTVQRLLPLLARLRQRSE